MREAEGLNRGNGAVNVFMRVYLSRICYLRITLICVQARNKTCVRETRDMRLISWIHHRGHEQYHQIHTQTPLNALARDHKNAKHTLCVLKFIKISQNVVWMFDLPNLTLIGYHHPWISLPTQVVLYASLKGTVS